MLGKLYALCLCKYVLIADTGRHDFEIDGDL